MALKSCGGTRGKTYKTVIETNIDELFIVTKELGIYIFPKEELKNKCKQDKRRNKKTQKY